MAENRLMLVPALTTLVTYFNQSLPARLPIVDGDGAPVPADRDARLATVAAELEALGFTARSTVAPADPDAADGTYARVLVDAAEETGAWVVDMCRGTATATYVELVTEWEDGTAVSTLNPELPSIFEPPPRVRRQHLRGAAVADVVAAHRAACAEVAGPRLDPLRDDPIAIAQAQNDEVLAHQEACGILRRRGAGYGFTLRGARRGTFRIYNAGRTAA